MRRKEEKERKERERRERKDREAASAATNGEADKDGRAAAEGDRRRKKRSVSGQMVPNVTRCCQM